MYRENTADVLEFNNNLLGYCTDRDSWEQLKLSKLIITTDDMDRITKCQLADLYYHKYYWHIGCDVASDKGITLKLKYNKDLRSGNKRGLFECVRNRQAMNQNQTINELQNKSPLEIQQF